MSFRCQMCSQAYPYAPYRRVVETRLVKYDTQIINDKGHRVDNVNSVGYEVAKELVVCVTCLKTDLGPPKTEAEQKVVKSTALKKRQPKDRDKDKDKKSRDRK